MTAARTKSAGALRTIGEVSQDLGIKPHVLRYWETQFPMLRPVKRSGSRRYYRPEDIALLGEIDRLVHREGYTLRGVRLRLEGEDVGKGVSAQPPLDADVSSAAGKGADGSLHVELVRLRDRLAQALETD